MTLPRSSHSRPALRLASLLVAGLPALIPHAGRTAASRGPARVATAATDSLPVDPGLTTGTLPNGLRYYIRANPTPAHRAELRLVVNAGSVLEDAEQRGLAHFLEHMAFNGTRHFPKHALIDYLESAGMRFGADLNAYTSFDETVYMLKVPTNDPKFLPRGLAMLADLAGGGITIDSNEVVAERGVVMGEWRSRLPDTASQNVVGHEDSVVYGGDSRYVTRVPIGDTAIIAHAEPGPIRRFYHEWYRPDLMAVVVVGDVDPREVARWIREHFATIPQPAHPRARVSRVVSTDSAPVIDVYRGQVHPIIDLLWKQPPRAAHTRSAFRDALVEQLLFEGLTRHFLALRERPHRPFFYAAIGRTPLEARMTDAVRLSVVASPDSLESALAAALGEVERTARYGIPVPTLERQRAALLRQFESAAAAEGAVPSAQYASAYTEHYLQGTVALMTPAQRLAVARDVVPTITPEDLARAARFWHRRSDLVARVTLPKFSHTRPPTETSIFRTLDSVARAPLSADSVRVLVDAPLLPHPPIPGRIVSERQEQAAGITEWTLSNGARVLFKPTYSNADELLIKAVSPGGFSLVPDSLFFSSGRLVAPMMNEAASVGALDRRQLEQKLATTVLREFHVAITNNDESISLGGSPKDLETLFQLLYLQFTSPKLDTAAIAGWKQVGTPGTFNIDDQLNYILSRGDPRRTAPPATLIQFADSQKALAVYRDRFGNSGDFTFLVVGAASAAQVRPLVERYVASLPSTGQHEAPKTLDVKPLDAIARQTERVFDIPKSSTFLAFDGPFPSAPEQWITERQRLSALGWVLQLKLTDYLRERLGGTYAVGVRDLAYADPAEHFRMEIGFNAAPEGMDAMQDALFAVLDSVRATGATPAELEKVAAIQQRTREEALQDNHYWMIAMETYDRLKIPFAKIAAPRTPIRSPDVIRAAAQHYLPSQSYIQFTLLPTDTSYTTRDSTVHARPESTAHLRATPLNWASGW